MNTQQELDRRGAILKKWDDVLQLSKSGKSFLVTGALRIGEANKIHYDMTQNGFVGHGVVMFNTGESIAKYYTPDGQPFHEGA